MTKKLYKYEIRLKIYRKKLAGPWTLGDQRIHLKTEEYCILYLFYWRYHDICVLYR